MEQCQLSLKRPHLESEPKSHPDGDRKRLRLESHLDTQVVDDASKQSAVQFEMLTNLVHEIKEVNIQLNRFMADFSANRKLAGGVVNISRSSCRICGQTGTQHMQDDDSEGSLTLNDDEDGSQLPL